MSSTATIAVMSSRRSSQPVKDAAPGSRVNWPPNVMLTVRPTRTPSLTSRMSRSRV
jgi:hypothetical protein